MRATYERLALLELLHAHDNYLGGGHVVFIGHGWSWNSGAVWIDHLGRH